MKHNTRIAAALLAGVLSLQGAGAAMYTSAEETTDAGIAVVDAVSLQKFLLGKFTLNDTSRQKLDLTGDGTVDAFDLAVMKRRLIENREPVQQMQNVQMQKVDTDAVTREGWDAAFADASYVFTSPEQFEAELGSHVKAPVLRHLQKTYTADFFKENVLCFKLVPISDEQTLNVDTAAVIVGDTIEIPYSFTGTAKYGRMVTAVELVLPKESYRGQEIVWKQKNAKPITVKYSTESLYGMETVRENADALISTQEEMIGFLSSTINEEGIADFKERYPASFFEENSLHMTLAWGHAAGYELADAVKCGDTISVTLRKNDEYGCVEQSLRIAEISKADLEGAQLELRHFNGMYSHITNHAAYYYGPFHSQTLVVQSVDYAEETDVELLYIPEQLIGCGVEPLVHCIKSVPMQEAGYNPITEEYTDPTWDENFVYDDETPVTYEGKDFRMVWREEGVCVQMKTGPDAESFEKVYIWEDPYQGEYFCEEHELFYCECIYE
ncbi:MAG: dockerin type I repeat-containing protein [Oscillospiraceae bacterium]|nr:dockerin type I repeat-containing protein [Oscillospiraceae bacterium]